MTVIRGNVDFRSPDSSEVCRSASAEDRESRHSQRFHRPFRLCPPYPPLPAIAFQASEADHIWLNSDETLCLVAAGHIENVRALRRRLEARAHRFTSTHDLECILHLYQDHRNEVWKKLRGMFAVAIYDRYNSILTLARDHMGIKPLFYYEHANSFLFGSEIRSITAHPLFKKEINTQALADFLSLQFIPKPQTIYNGLLSLPPASVLTLKNSDVSVRKYWAIDPRNWSVDLSTLSPTKKTGRAAAHGGRPF